MNDWLLDHPDILHVVFHPRSAYSATSESPDARIVTIPVAPDVAVGGKLYPADYQSPLILYFHGNGEIADDYDDLAPLYNRIGITLLVVDYRGYGISQGTPSASTLLTDAVAVFEALPALCEDEQLAPLRTYVMGRSLGSVPAIEIALQVGERLTGLIVESGFADTFGLLARLGIRAQRATEQQDGFQNAEKMTRIVTPTCIIHGQNDVLIPPSDGEELYRCAAASDKTLVLIPRGGHNDLMMIGMTEYFTAIKQFVHRV